MQTKKFTKYIDLYLPIFMDWIRYKKGDNKNWIIRKNILDHYRTIPQWEIDDEKQEALNYIKKKGVKTFPYAFIDKYDYSKIKVYKDEECDLKYVLHNGHKLYFARNLSIFIIKRLYNSLLIEQDPESAHYYETENCKVNNGDILFDIGAAEGIFALTMIEKLKTVYLFEREERWLEALQQTFKPWNDKVVIINKYVSDKDSNSTIKIDSITQKLDDGSLFLKIDVEGAEESVINGSNNTLTSDKFRAKAVVCTYHNAEDHEKLSAIMKNLSYNTTTSKGYMLFLSDNQIPPYFRRGVIYCSK